ncbi:MAG TPA: hypothetical protein VMJ32_08725 [Pirellulales bacterium]|nr:hypothetical protein [Pirellulales bacterium]
MKFKAIFVSWPHVALILLVSVQASFLWMCMNYIAPIYERFRYEGWLEGDEKSHGIMSWANSMVWNTLQTLDTLATLPWLCVLGLAAWGACFLFRRSQNKQVLGLWTLTTAALGLMILIASFTAVLSIPLLAAVPTMYNSKPETIVKERLATVDMLCDVMAQAFNKRDWNTMEEATRLAIHGMNDLATMGAAAPAIVSFKHQQRVDELRTDLQSASEVMKEIESAIQSRDVSRLQASMTKFHDKYAPVQ